MINACGVKPSRQLPFIRLTAPPPPPQLGAVPASVCLETEAQLSRQAQGVLTPLWPLPAALGSTQLTSSLF